MKDFKIAQADLNYLDSPTDKTQYVLKDVYEENHISPAEQTGLFIGIAVIFQGNDDLIRIEELGTILGTPVSQSPYSGQPLTAFLGKKRDIHDGDCVIISVTVGTMKRTHEILKVKTIYRFDELGIQESLLPAERAKKLCESRKMAAYKDAIVTMLNESDEIYDEAERLAFIKHQIEGANTEKQSLDELIGLRQAEVTELSQQRTQLTLDIEELKKLLVELPRMREERDELNAVLPSLRDERQMCQSTIDAHNGLVAEIHTLQQEKTRLERSLPAMRKEKEELADVLVDYIAVKEKYDLLQSQMNHSAIVYEETVYPYTDTPQLDFSAENGGLQAFKRRLNYNYQQDEVEKFLLALSTTQIITLCGDPGTGKTTFVSEICDALGAVCHMIEVQNNWTDKSDILGYFNPLNGGHYQSTRFLDALLQAKRDLDQNGHNARLHVICLDEMNLARVEYYFATFLSLLQQKERNIYLLPTDLDKMAVEPNSALHPYQHFEIPSNVRFVGTLNMDESAQGLSPKVIDRCFFIEFEKGNSTHQVAERKKGYYPARNFEEHIDIEIPEQPEGVFTDLVAENARFIKYAHQMYQMAVLLRVSDDEFADCIVAAKVLPRIKRVSDFSPYINKPRFRKSNIRFSHVEKYGENRQLCDYWRKE